ncbi:MAG: type II toxin-antitoxin system HicA family toxin [Candidatus Hydrogenedentota bacterium]
MPFNEQRIVPLDYRKLIKIFELEGFNISNRKGDHISMTKPGVKRPVVIKCGHKQVPVAHIRTNLTTAGISRQRYFDLLAQL